MKLLRKLILDLPRKNLVFDPKKGRFYNKRSQTFLVSIKDPFIKKLNYGFEMRDKDKMRHLCQMLEEFLKSASTGTFDRFLLEPNLISDSTGSSKLESMSIGMSNKTSSGDKQGSGGKADLEEAKGGQTRQDTL